MVGMMIKSRSIINFTLILEKRDFLKNPSFYLLKYEKVSLRNASLE